MPVDSEKVRRLIAEVADEEVMPRFEKLETGDISEKSPGDFVTIADVASERRLTPALRDLLPGSLVVGEEAVAADPAVLDLRDHGRAGPARPNTGGVDSRSGQAHDDGGARGGGSVVRRSTTHCRAWIDAR